MQVIAEFQKNGLKIFSQIIFFYLRKKELMNYFQFIALI
jgi:hypothetical protein